MVGEEQVAPFVRSPRPIAEECQGDAFLKHLREPGAREAGAGVNLKMLTLEWGGLPGTFENNRHWVLILRCIFSEEQNSKPLEDKGTEKSGRDKKSR